ncbi:hypothetical protein D3C80_1760130 [compost metagenome]
MVRSEPLVISRYRSLTNGMFHLAFISVLRPAISVATVFSIASITACTPDSTACSTPSTTLISAASSLRKISSGAVPRSCRYTSAWANAWDDSVKSTNRASSSRNWLNGPSAVCISAAAAMLDCAAGALLIRPL